MPQMMTVQPSDGQIDAAAVKWCSDVQCRIPEDILHFLENWWLVPELRVYVERECAK